MKILFIGDIVARPGRYAVREVLPNLIKENKIDFVVANAENLAHGRGATPETLLEMQNLGVNYFTGGDHVYWHKGFEESIDSLPIVRPATFVPGSPGKGYAIVDAGKLGNILIINLMGRTTFGNKYYDDPFRAVDAILDDVKDKTITFSILDFHAEATSEKYAMGYYLDGRINAVLGTHTHVPTCDGAVFPKGTFYISDVGMTGAIESVIGVKKEIIIAQFTTGQHQKYEWENTGTKAFRSVLLDTERNTIERIDKYLA